MAVLFLNIGNSDLMPRRSRIKDGNEVKWCEDHLREWESAGVGDGKHGIAVANGIKMPLIEPVLRKLNARDQQIDLLVMFVTRQQGVSQRLSDKDTYCTGELIEKLIKSGLLMLECTTAEGGSQVIPWGDLIKEIRLETISHQPHHIDEMHAYYSTNLQVIHDQMEQAIGEAMYPVYVSLAGGTPAMNLGLFYAALNLKGNSGRIHYLYTEEPSSEEDDTPEATMLTIGKVILQDDAKKVATRLLNNYDYSGLVTVMDDLGLDVPGLKDIVRGMKYRVDFAFDQAVGAFTDVGRTGASADTRRLANDLRTECQILNEGLELYQSAKSPWTSSIELRTLIAELYWGLSIRLSTRRWHDILTRLVSLLERCLKIKAVEVVGLHLFRSITQSAINAAVKHGPLPKSVDISKGDNLFSLGELLKDRGGLSGSAAYWYQGVLNLSEFRNKRTVHGIGPLVWSEVWKRYDRYNSPVRASEETLISRIENDTKTAIRDLFGLDLSGSANPLELANQRIIELLSEQ